MTTLLNQLVTKVAGTSDPVPIPEFFMKGILDRADREPQRGRAGSYLNHVHVSSLAYDFCPRQYAIALHEKLQLNESLTGGHKVTFAIGRAVEHHIRTGFIEQYGRENIYAKWTCDCGNMHRQGFYKEVVCVDCHKPLDVFNEADIQDDENGVKGHPDLIFRYKNKLVVVEIKSIKKDAWDELTEPQDAHIKQAMMYPYLLSKQTNQVHPTVIYIYCTKDFKFGSPYKEFHVNSSEQKYETLRQELLAEAKQVKDYVVEKKTPPRICNSMASSLAKKCPVAFRCFNVYQDEVR